MKFSRLLPALVVLALFAGCSSNVSNPGNGTMRVHLTDKPGSGDIEAVNLVVTEVSVRTEEMASESDSDSVSTSGGWQTLSTTTKTYDLMKLQNGVFTTIGEASLPAGTYTQIRLKLGPGSNVVVDGTTLPLKVPSGMQSGLKLIGTFNVPPGGTTDVGLDFDASRSLHETGSGQWMLKPVVKAFTMTAAGSIHGIVVPDSVATSVVAIQPPDTLGSAQTGAGGQFTISVLAPGSYSLAFHPAEGFRDTTLTNIMVTVGTTTEVDTVRLSAP
jgi:uncharacterized protein DUF4382/carboxypeptidase family protein